MPITTCTVCGGAFQVGSEEQANEAVRLCGRHRPPASRKRPLTKTDLARMIVFVRAGMTRMPRAGDPRVRRMVRRDRQALEELHQLTQQIQNLSRPAPSCADPDEAD